MFTVFYREAKRMYFTQGKQSIAQLFILNKINCLQKQMKKKICEFFFKI